MFMSVWKSDEKLLISASLISPGKIFCLIKHSTQSGALNANFRKISVGKTI